MVKDDIKSAYFSLIFWFVLAVCVKIISYYPEWIEFQYSADWYVTISRALRTVLGLVPLSVGDILYGYWVVYLIIIIIDVSKSLIKKSLDKGEFIYHSVGNIKSLLIIYVIFNVFWGLNYNRLGIEQQLKLKAKEYSLQELQDLTNTLIDKANIYRKTMGDAYKYPETDQVFKNGYIAYQYVAGEYPFMEYRKHSIKKSLYGKLGNYVGFIGYYNPFTGEAQVNATVPPFILPFTTCHEIAHQLGYASESEANFVGFLAAKSSDDSAFRYSAYFELFLYANSEVRMRDSVQAQKNFEKLDSLVQKDVLELRKFNRDHESFIEPLTRKLYGEYLRLNNQPMGMKSYNEVIAWLIAYRRQYNDI